MRDQRFFSVRFFLFVNGFFLFKSNHISANRGSKQTVNKKEKKGKKPVNYCCSEMMNVQMCVCCVVSGCLSFFFLLLVLVCFVLDYVALCCLVMCCPFIYFLPAGVWCCSGLS